MTNNVKEFIEQNINLIDTNSWFQLFAMWYDSGYTHFPDTEEFEDLMNVLKVINKNIDRDTISHRKNIIVMVTRATISDIRSNPSVWKKETISLKWLVQHLDSALGLDNSTIIDCIMDAAEQQGLTYNVKTAEFEGIL